MDTRARGSPFRDGTAPIEHDDEGEWLPARPNRATKRATTKSRRKDKSLKFPDLEVPLSVWGADNNVQPQDVADFATRDIDQRITRALKDGYVKRNLNIFFLYKRAYSRVAQAWLTQYHPSMSKTQPPLVTLVGESWKKESAGFKSYYNKFSEQEREGLKNAFPDYKYKPGAKKAQVKHNEVEEQRVHDFNDYNSANTLNGHRSGHFVDHTQDTSRRLYATGPGAFNEPAALPSQGLPYYSNAYGMPPMATVHEAGPMITDQANVFLHPHRPGWAHSVNERAARSVSPAASQLSYQTDYVPIDPSLPDTFSDCVPSREASEEPGFIAPSQLTYSRMPSAEPMVREPSDLDSDWVSAPAMSRCASEEPWQAMPDAFLSSLPTNDISDPAANEHYWQLETLEKNEPPSGFAWDAQDWEHDLDDELAGF